MADIDRAHHVDRLAVTIPLGQVGQRAMTNRASS